MTVPLQRASLGCRWMMEVPTTETSDRRAAPVVLKMKGDQKKRRPSSSALQPMLLPDVARTRR